jgi:hypothetical protein
MIIAPVGDIPKVMGRSIDMAPTGPSPGRTPTSVPATAPRKAHNRFAGCITTLKPYRMR